MNKILSYSKGICYNLQHMNLHPFIVHFPIGLLATYSILEYFRFKKVHAQQYWFYIKALLVTLGVISAQIAIIFGGLIEDMFINLPAKNSIVPVHSMWAAITFTIYLLIALSYLIIWINKDMNTSFFKKNPLRVKLWKKANSYSVFMQTPSVLLILSTFGLISLMITGSLGGAMALGVDTDPVVNFVYHLFV